MSADAQANGGRDIGFMRQALEQARRAEAAGEVPVGAVLVFDDRVIATGANAPIGRCDPTAHAEMEALRAGAHAVGNYRLAGCELYVTLEPCPMCASALVHARVARVIFGAWDQQFGAAGSLIDLFRLPGLNHRVDAFGGVLSQECNQLLSAFFERQRQAPR